MVLKIRKDMDDCSIPPTQKDREDAFSKLEKKLKDTNAEFDRLHIEAEEHGDEEIQELSDDIYNKLDNQKKKMNDFKTRFAKLKGVRPAEHKGLNIAWVIKEIRLLRQNIADDDKNLEGIMEENAELDYLIHEKKRADEETALYDEINELIEKLGLDLEELNTSSGKVPDLIKYLKATLNEMK